MKRLIFLTLSVIFSISTGAQQITFSSSDKFLITEMNVDSILIGGKLLSKRDSFEVNQAIHWRGHDGDMFVALWMGHNEYFSFEYNRSIKNDRQIIHYIKSNKTLHKGVGEAKDILNNVFYATTDTVFVETPNVLDDNHYFIFRYKGQKYNLPLINEHIFYIKLSDYPFIFDENGNVRLRVSYVSVDKVGGLVEESVTSNMVISKITLKKN